MLLCLSLETRTPRGERPDNRAHVIEIASQPIHRVRDECVTVGNEPEHCIELWPPRILARGVVGEALVERGMPSISRPRFWSRLLTRCSRPANR